MRGQGGKGNQSKGGPKFKSPGLSAGRPVHPTGGGDFFIFYVQGNLYYMIGAHTITDPNPNLLAQAEEMYILIYPINPTGSRTLGPLALPSGYQPLCNPCFHPGLKPEWVYHDHVLTGAPGLGNNGTAGEYLGPWKIIRMVYDPAVALDPNFQPIKSVEDIKAAEAAGEFLPVNQSAENPYEIDTGRVLICPFVSPHA